MNVIIAKNQTAGALALTQISVPDNEIPASGQVTLTDFATMAEIQEDTELSAHIAANDAILNVDGVDLSAADSAAFAAPPSTAIFMRADGAFAAPGGATTSKMACCPFGAKSDGTGNFLIANGKSSDGDDSSKPKTRHAIGVDGTLSRLVYQTKEATNSTVMKVHINGAVAATVTLASINATFGGVEAISVSVGAGDTAEIEYDTSDKPGECTMYFIQEVTL